MREQPGAVTPWQRINQLLAPDERHLVQASDQSRFLLTPKHASQLAALLYFLFQENIPYAVEGAGSIEPLIVSPRFFQQMVWHPHGVAEVGAGCSLSTLRSFLFENKHEVPLEGMGSLKKTALGLILSGVNSADRCRGETLFDSIVGCEMVTWDGSQVRWGGAHRSPAPGHALHKQICAGAPLPGIVTRLMLKAYPIPPQRLRLAWRFTDEGALLEQMAALKRFSRCWDFLDIARSEDPEDPLFLFGEMSGSIEEMEAFSLHCPGYDKASQRGERAALLRFYSQKSRERENERS